ncbi:hypothetical protein LTR84_008016 [Exophiala bonariae]|uniref:tryptophan--tRNA ligase n=1 Tax=Exophiala bonariae TaxID=1690606 RepID=A0AAV9NP50_9EURO|nr:hypothetical protein LTR84_008016 [Exophiala bonariae]
MLSRACRPSLRLLQQPSLWSGSRSFYTSGKSYQPQTTSSALDKRSTASDTKHAASDLVLGDTQAEAHTSAEIPQVVFSGIQPTGVPHLGNYIGALRQWKNYHDASFSVEATTRHSTEQYFSIVDLHALTASLPKEQRKQLRKESFASLLAIGLKNTGTTTVFFQSHVSHHSELMWILSNVASTGYLSRMTQWKSKLNLPDETSLDADEATAVLKLGLFSYPVLQAADILLYDTTLVPVGHDQLQHVEFTRNLARSFNSYLTEADGKPVFTIPEAVVVPGKRIMSLRKPTQKMSKSDTDPRSRISIIDSPEEIRQKLRAAVTDSLTEISYDPETRPGVSNLIEIYKHVTEIPASCHEIARDNQNLSMKGLKDMVSTAIIKELGDIRPRFLQLMKQDNEILTEEIALGASRAQSKAGAVFSNVQKSLGIS